MLRMLIKNVKLNPDPKDPMSLEVLFRSLDDGDDEDEEEEPQDDENHHHHQQQHPHPNKFDHHYDGNTPIITRTKNYGTPVMVMTNETGMMGNHPTPSFHHNHHHQPSWSSSQSSGYRPHSNFEYIIPTTNHIGSKYFPSAPINHSFYSKQQKPKHQIITKDYARKLQSQVAEFVKYFYSDGKSQKSRVPETMK